MHLRLICLLVNHLLHRILLLSLPAMPCVIVSRFNLQTGLLSTLFFPSQPLTAMLFIIRNGSM
uniref:Uncharacterized protein n=1 Tax=Arundo donax TaxID=35708 RepID=A0A0A8Z4E5_ARUDO